MHCGTCPTRCSVRWCCDTRGGYAACACAPSFPPPLGVRSSRERVQCIAGNDPHALPLSPLHLSPDRPPAAPGAPAQGRPGGGQSGAGEGHVWGGAGAGACVRAGGKCVSLLLLPRAAAEERECASLFRSRLASFIHSTGAAEQTAPALGPPHRTCAGTRALSLSLSLFLPIPGPVTVRAGEPAVHTHADPVRKWPRRHRRRSRWRRQSACVWSAGRQRCFVYSCARHACTQLWGGSDVRRAADRRGSTALSLSLFLLQFPHQPPRSPPSLPLPVSSSSSSSFARSTAWPRRSPPSHQKRASP